MPIKIINSFVDFENFILAYLGRKFYISVLCLCIIILAQIQLILMTKFLVKLLKIPFWGMSKLMWLHILESEQRSFVVPIIHC